MVADGIISVDNRHYAATQKSKVLLTTTLKNSETETIKGHTNPSKDYTGLEEGTKYYFQVCTFKTVNGKDYDSAWSSKKAVTTKKTSKKDKGNSSLDKLTMSKVFSMTAINGKQFNSYTPESLLAFLKKNASYEQDGEYYKKTNKGDYFLGYGDDPKKDWIGVVYDVVYDDDPYDFMRGGFLHIKYTDKGDIWYSNVNHPSGNIEKNTNNGVTYKSPLKKNLKETAETICLGLYDKVKDGQTYKGKTYEAKLVKDEKGGELQIRFDNGDAIDIWSSPMTGTAQAVGLDITTKK